MDSPRPSSGRLFGVILGSVLGRFFFQWMYDRTMSGTGYDIFRDYRLEIGEKLKQAPMGYFSEQNLGTIQTILTTTIADLEGYSMLAIEQMTSGVAMAALMSIMMFFFTLSLPFKFDWTIIRFTCSSLVPQ